MKWLLPILVLLMAIASCKKQNATEATVEEGRTANQYDAELAADVAKGQEARAWLAREDTTMFEISKADARDLVEKAYAAGATRVVMTGTVKEPEVEIGATFVVELPDDAAKREAVFKVAEDWTEDPEADTGQKFLPIYTD